MAEPDTLRIPLHTVAPQLDIDSPDYRAANPSTYLLLALCHETLAGPSTMPDALGIPAPDALSMAPRLAAGWREDPDGHWRVRLRPGILSHTGNELTADDIRWGLARVFAVASTGAWRWGQIFGLASPDDVQVVDRYTVRYQLRRPDPFFPTRLFSATPNLVDSAAARLHSTADDPWSTEWLAANVAGYGAYQLEAADRTSASFVARNGEPAGRVRLETVTSRAEALDLLHSPEPVYLLGLRSAEAARLSIRDDVNLVGAWAGHATLEMDYSRPPFCDVRVRHALSYATPYQDLIDRAFHRLARPIRGPLKTYSPWYSDRSWNYYPDLAHARRLLRAAGYGDGLQVTLHLPARDDAAAVAEVLIGAYAAAGITLVPAELSELAPGEVPPLHLRLDCGHNITEPLYDLAHDYAPVHPAITPGGRVGIARWQPRYTPEPTLLRMYRDTLLAADAATRRERCLALQRAIVAFAPCVPLAEQPLFNAGNPRVPANVLDHSHRINQVTLFQNGSTSYLPG